MNKAELKLVQKSVDIPEFCKRPQRFVTLNEREYVRMQRKHNQDCVNYFDKGFTAGLITMGLVFGALVIAAIIAISNGLPIE